MLPKLDDQGTKDDYQAFAARCADVWAKGWLAEDCDDYEEGLIKQEKLVIEAVKREGQYEIMAQPPKNYQRPQTSGRLSRSAQPSQDDQDQGFEQQAQTCIHHAETASLPGTQLTYTDSVSKQSQGSLDLIADKHDGMGKAARGGMQGLTKGTTTSLGNQRLSGKSAKLNVRLDLAGANDKKTSRHLRWSPDDTRDEFFHKVVELFPGTAIQQVSVRLLHGTAVNVPATGPEGEWEIAQEEWLERLVKPSKKPKEPSADVHLVEPA